MGIKLNWPSLAKENLDSIEIYRSNAPVSRDNPGTPLVVLASDATNYEDETVRNKSIYYYRMASVKGGVRGWGENKQEGYFSETGPGRTVPLRGNWDSGWMDYIPTAQFIDGAGLRAKIGDGKLAGGNPTSWYKLCYKGKVLFIPNSYALSLSHDTAYAYGLLFGEDGVGQLPSGPAGNVNQRCVVEIGGLQYLVRMPRVSSQPTTEYVLDASTAPGSEFFDLIMRLISSGSDTTVNQKAKLFDNTEHPGEVLGPHLQTAANVAAYRRTPPVPMSAVAKSTALDALVILELIMP